MNSNKKAAIYVLDPYHADAIASLQQFQKLNPDLDLVLPSEPRKSTYHENATVVLVRSETRITAADFQQCKRLECIVKQGTGVDNIDLQAAKEAGVAVYNTPGLNSEAVAELALSLTLSLSRRVTEIDRRVRRGETVVRSQTLGKSLYRATLGVVGMGNIGRALAAKWMAAMEGEVIGYDPYSDGSQWTSFPRFRRADSLDQLLETSDVVSLHVPLTDSTRNCIAASQFDKMKSGAILINCARGGIVDEEALLVALKSGKLFGAGLDAMQVEPPTLEAYGSMLELQNIILTPHIGASTAENQSQSGLATVEVALSQVRGDIRGNRVA